MKNKEREIKEDEEYCSLSEQEKEQIECETKQLKNENKQIKQQYKNEINSLGDKEKNIQMPVGTVAAPENSKNEKKSQKIIMGERIQKK